MDDTNPLNAAKKLADALLSAQVELRQSSLIFYWLKQVTCY
jgi:hypothetical protein